MLQQRRETRRSLTRDYMEAGRCMEQGQEVGSSTDRSHQSTAKHKGSAREKYPGRAACPVVSCIYVSKLARKFQVLVALLYYLGVGVRAIDFKICCRCHDGVTGAESI